MTERRHPYLIGVTGNIACGKSTVLAELGRLGAETIDADRLYHTLIVPATSLNAAIVDRFGSAIRSENGEIDRRALGKIVFSDPAALSDLEKITHPAVMQATRDSIAASDSAIVAIDAVKLIESGLSTICDQVWLVVCDPARQLERLMRRNELTREDAERRIDAQPPVDPKKSLASAVIDNSGTEAETVEKVRELWTALPILQH